MQTFSFPSSLARRGARAQGRRWPGGAALGLALLLGACAQPGTSRMGGPGDSAEPGVSQPARSDRERRRLERPRKTAGDVNRSDTNLEHGGQPAGDAFKSGPPSTVKPVQ